MIKNKPADRGRRAGLAGTGARGRTRGRDRAGVPSGGGVRPVSRQSCGALSFVMGLAVPLQAYLHVAHVVDLDDFPVEPDRDDWERRIVDTVERERTEACTMLAQGIGATTELLLP